jgi:hypothetical protein
LRQPVLHEAAQGLGQRRGRARKQGSQLLCSAPHTAACCVLAALVGAGLLLLLGGGGLHRAQELFQDPPAPDAAAHARRGVAGVRRRARRRVVVCVASSASGAWAGQEQAHEPRAARLGLAEGLRRGAGEREEHKSLRQRRRGEVPHKLVCTAHAQ